LSPKFPLRLNLWVARAVDRPRIVGSTDITVWAFNGDTTAADNNTPAPRTHAPLIQTSSQNIRDDIVLQLIWTPLREARLRRLRSTLWGEKASWVGRKRHSGRKIGYDAVALRSSVKLAAGFVD